MADSTNSTDVPSSSSPSVPKNVRGPTMMTAIMKVRQTGEKIPVEFDERTGECLGVKDHVCWFRSYAALVARQKCSILLNEWSEVGEDIKDAIWTELKNYFTIPECADKKKDRLRKEWIKYAGERWRDFKTRLTGDYITRPNPKLKPPYIRYKYITKDVWDNFVKSRETEEFKAKSQKGRENKAKNQFPHVTSRGGYKWLEEKMINEHISSKDPSTLTDDDLRPPSRAAKWKRARTKKSGEYTSDASKVVAERIDSLVEEMNEGTFVPDGRKDILTEAIGTAEHGGRVRGVGQRQTLSTYFGRSSSRQRQVDAEEQITQITINVEAKIRADLEKKFAEERKMFAEERQRMEQSFMDTLKSMGLSQSSDMNKQAEPACTKLVAVTGSGKGSCSAAHEKDKQDIDNVKKLLLMVLRMGTDHLEIRLSHCPRLVDFFVSTKCIKELLVGHMWVDVGIISIWCTYIHRVCIERNLSDVYGILEPAELNIVQDDTITQTRTKTYIQDRLRDQPKLYHLLPFNHGGHWQLIILCPRDNTVVVLCSLHYQLNATMKKIVERSFAVYQLAANGNRRRATWLYPKTRRQPNSNDCGYYVMRNMLDVVSGHITGNWMEVFNDPKELSEDELYDLRELWATCFFELYGH
ncbi:hypothetical protein QL285_089634 [Trifolium repens]|nr:hypothetical protein QL285_089634 [Trifolium repens]